MAQPKLYLVTHGETKLDQEGRIHGQTVDAPLSQKGILTARKLGRQLIGKGIGTIYSSPLTRARQTADIVAKQIGASVVVKQELLPWHIGRLGGAKTASVKPVLDFFSSRPDREVPYGESKNQFLSRYQGIFEKLRRSKSSIAIVAHSQHSLALDHVSKGGDAAKVPVVGGKREVRTISL